MNSSRFLRIALLGIPLALSALADDWPQWLGPQRDSVWRETGILEKFPAGGPPRLWHVPMGGGFTGPAVADGHVFVLDRQLATATNNPANPFARGVIPGFERVLCLRATDGQLVWQHQYEAAYTVSYAAGPRATPLVRDGKVFTLGAEGHLTCLDTATGKPLWSHVFGKEFGAKTPIWGFAGHPLLLGNKLICLVGAENGVAMAFDKDTGRELWRALSAKEPGYAPPTLIEVAGRKQLVIWHPEAANGLDPETGKVLWTQPVKANAGMSIATPRQSGDLLFITSFYNGALALRFDPKEVAPAKLYASAKPSEKDTDMLHCVMSSPFIEDGYVYGTCSYGQLRCVKLATGERVWETFAATTGGQPVRWGTAFLVKQADRFFLFNEQGDLIIARLSPKGYEEVSRAKLLEPTNRDPGRAVVWSHPAFAGKCIFVRNDRELVAYSLAAP